METEREGWEVTDERASEIKRRTQPGEEEVGKLQAVGGRPRTQRKNILTASYIKQLRPLPLGCLCRKEGTVNRLPRYCTGSVGFHPQSEQTPISEHVPDTERFKVVSCWQENQFLSYWLKWECSRPADLCWILTGKWGGRSAALHLPVLRSVEEKLCQKN